MINTNILTENSFDMSAEKKYGTLFTTSNGYMGIRGSLEENGTIGVQGGFVRGLIDEIQFCQNISIDSEYMRKFYINEDAAKDAQVQEGIINFADILFFQISIDEETFYPWTGKILSWKRTLDMKNNLLFRSVKWENSKGDITEFIFKRFASFANDHFYVMSISIKPVNHNKTVRIVSGLDLRTKSNGFKMTNVKTSKTNEKTIRCSIQTEGKYNHDFDIAVCHDFVSLKNICNDKFITQETRYLSNPGEEKVFEKKICVTTSRDIDGYSINDGIREFEQKDFSILFEEHRCSWSVFFDKIDIKIDGDDEFDRALRFCNYHNAISIPRNDSVHSLSAKNLTGEGYNDYVWWDCEVFQCPVFIYSGTDSVKNMFKYRYDRLNEAKKYALSEGYKGARFPFISSVTGEEKVWKHVRHPYLQVHVTADIAWGVINYYNAFGDDDFMKRYGIELLTEISEYWISRAEFVNGRYEIRNVAGCDEHHPFVNNDAYTNYLVHYCLTKTKEIAIKFNVKYADEIDDICKKLYLPKEKTGFIPQFDGYFNLSQTLESVGGGGRGFQMKTAGGQYHLSQIIKQPDVMMLFSYIPNSFSQWEYQVNWDYYEQMCECSSSLTYPVHAICSFDNNQLYKGYKYMCSTVKIDIDDIHNCCESGIHAGCSAGAWYGIVRGLLGIEMSYEFVKINPKMLPWWNRITVNLSWHGSNFKIVVDNDGFVITAEGDIRVLYKDKEFEITGGESADFKFERCINEI